MSSHDSLDRRCAFPKGNEEDPKTRNEAASEFSKSWSMTLFFVAFSLFIISEGLGSGEIVICNVYHAS